ncbi:uncharacterized protein NEPG_01023 [Nematocida parisii ERTm1]|uniref:uncharacterized protein n=1 Tax=Nematocida parisii (strain ERTm1 / ATCC PRA-289) TaxID=881290 RepID=UPI000264B202|nr:uncharacterized protein NEPG_01023 [Nematocida parisii ERTm1]EIJ94355.1 hypothetical protein NEPG_01023 [Nematocida parisii ERTm1]|eukprot:XP_013058851.1 hypothetical protein NEPG_01023 [Nematocida parisii ERTm1]
MNNSKNSTTRIAQNIKEVLTTIKAKECTVKRRLQTLKNSNIIVLAVVVLFLREIYSSNIEMVSNMLSVVENYTISSPEIGDVEIHPDGNLNLMMSYVHTKSGHMMILRCLNTNIIMGHPEKMVEMHNQLNRDSTKYNTGKDMLNPILPYEGNVLEYIKEHHAILLWLYDSNGMMSYNSKKDDLAHLFAMNSINGKDEDEYIEGDYKLMAALFLLSEGLKLPLKHEHINDEPKITLYKYNEDNENTIFQINDIPWNENKKNQNVRELINFLFKYYNSPVLEAAGFKDPTNYEEYATGNFIYTPGFLIRTYIYHYLNRIKRTEPKLFVNAVHDILRLYMPKKEQTSDKTDIQSKAEEIFKKLFMVTSNSESDIKKKKRLMIRDIKNILEVNDFLYNPNSCNLAKKETTELVDMLSADLSNRENDSFMRIALNDYMKYLSVHKKYNNEDENGIAKYMFELSKEQFEMFSKNKLIGIKHCVPYAGIPNQYDLAFLLIARAFRMNLKRTDPVMMLIKNLLANAYRKISVVNNEQEYLVHYIAAFILETYIDGRPNITSILDPKSLKTDEMLEDSTEKLKPISDILVYLSVKRADSALIKFILAYKQMEKIYNNLCGIGKLIEEKFVFLENSILKI